MATPKKTTATKTASPSKKKANESKQQKATDIDVQDTGATDVSAGFSGETPEEPAVFQTPVHEQSGSGKIGISGNSGTVEEQIITVLIPYLASAAAGDELKYALRAWEKNFDGTIRVVVVGDKEDWFSKEITHLPLEVHTIPDCLGCPNPKQIRNPQADVAHKLLFAVTSGAVNGQFILTNDDIYLLGPTTLSDLQQPKVLGNLVDITKKGMYADNARRTAAMLKSAGKETLNYGTHTPMVLDSIKLADTIRGYQATEKGILLTSAYFNHHEPEPRGLIKLNGGATGTILLSVYSDIPPTDIVLTAFKRRKYLNCNSKGWKAINWVFKQEFPEKSRFEK